MFLKNKKSLLFSLIIVIALVFRLPQLSERPMHGDEAVNAIKFSELLESGKFIYNPAEYHGPALSYFTLPVVWLSGNSSLKDLTEITLRLVPALFGLGLILLLLSLGAGVNWYILCIAALISAISPSFVYYSRYYIHEILLVFFCYAVIFTGYRYCLNRKFIWMLISALSLGMMISTKETWIILVFMIFLSISLIFIPFKEKRVHLLSFIKSIPLRHFVGFLAILLLTILLFYTSFLQYPQGIKDSISAYSTYFQRAGNNEYHIHSWYMYFKWLLFFGREGGLFWSEGLIAIFAIFGIISILTKTKFTSGEQLFYSFILIFVLGTSLIFSLIPYKTPWNMLTFWFGYILIGSIGYVYLLHKSDKKITRVILLIVSFVLVVHLGWQSYQLNFNKSFSIDNPYVYAHPVDDVLKITERLEEIAQYHPDEHQIYIQIIAGKNDYWPLPWYLRKFNRIGWWDRVDLETAAAPVIIAQAELEDELIHRLYQIPPPGLRDLYLPLFEEYIELRPGIEFRGYIRKDVSDFLNALPQQLNQSESE